MEKFIRDFRVGDFPLISGMLTDRDYLKTEKDVMAAVDLIELRVDMFSSVDSAHVKNIFKKVRDIFNKPIIATIRDVREGGEKAVANRLDLYRGIIPLSDVIDVEINADDLFPEIRKLCSTFGKLVIGSFHNFDFMPEQAVLEGIANKAFVSKADIAKIAVHAKTRKDLLDLFAFALNNRDRRLITVAMGERGLPSRIFMPVIGSPISYGYINVPSAPGQFSVVEMMAIFRKLKLR